MLFYFGYYCIIYSDMNYQSKARETLITGGPEALARDLIELKNTNNDEFDKCIKDLSELLDWLFQKDKAYRNERFPRMDKQLELTFTEMMTAEDKQKLPEEVLEEEEKPAKKRKSGKNRKSLLESSNIRIQEVTHEASPSNPDMVFTGKYEKVSKLVYTPYEFYREDHLYPIYVLPGAYDDEGHEITEACGKEPDLIQDSPATEEVIAHLACSSYLTGVPFYRQQKRLESVNVTLSRQTMTNWLDQVYNLYLERVNRLIQEDFCELSYVHLDETTHKVVANRKNRTTNYELVGLSGRSESRQMIIFLYSPDRTAEIVSQMIGDNFKHAMQTDGYRPYHAYGETHEGVVNIGCWAHAQKKLKEGRDTDPCLSSISRRPKADQKASLIKNPALREYWVLTQLVAKMMVREADLNPETMSWDEIRKDRETYAKPLMDLIFEKAEALEKKFPGQNKKAAALKYLLGQKEYLVKVLEDGRYEMTNMPVERQVKNFVIWRKNSLFSNTENGAERVSAFMTVLKTAQLNHLNPEKYLTWLLHEMRTRQISDAELREMLPYSANLPETVKI